MGTDTGPETEKGTCTVLLFAAASTFAGGAETLLLPAPTTLRGVVAALEARFPGMRDKVVASAAVTVNLEYVDFDPEALVRRADADADAAKEGPGQGPGAEGHEGINGSGEGDGLDLVIRIGDEVGIIPPVSSG